MRNSSFPDTCVLKEIFIGNTVKDKFTVIQPVWTYAMYLPSGLGMGLYALSVASIDSLELCALAPNAKIKIPTSSERNALVWLA